MRIGIFDSGLGGLLLAKTIMEALPSYDYIYLGDTKNVPYGGRSEEAIYELTKNAVDYLFRQNCVLIILACNTASAVALRKIQREYLPANYPDRRVLGVLVPLAEAAAEATDGTVGILATEATVKSGAFVREIKKLNKSVSVKQKAAPLLVPLIENDGIKWVEPILKEYLADVSDQKTIVLGCTHYSIIRQHIERVLGESTKIICQTDVLPIKLHEYLIHNPSIDDRIGKNGERRFLVTDVTNRLGKISSEWFGNKLNLEVIDY